MAGSESHCSSVAQNYQSHFLENFKPIKTLGEGGFGIVLKADHKLDQGSYAIKRICLSKSGDELEKYTREVKALATLNHKNIVGYYHTWTENPPQDWQEKKDKEWKTSSDSDSKGDLSSEEYDMRNVLSTLEEISGTPVGDYHNKTTGLLHTEPTRPRLTTDSITPKTFLYIQMELCRDLNLQEWLEQPVHRGKEVIICIVTQLLEGVEYIHKHRFIHRDLKPSNVLFSFDGLVKIGDFGLVTSMFDSYDEDFGENHSPGLGTVPYMSPEQLANIPYSCKVDIYALGLILAELLMQFQTKSERAASWRDLRSCIFPPYFIESFPLEYDLLVMMLSEEPSNRPTAATVRDMYCDIYPEALEYIPFNDFE